MLLKEKYKIEAWLKQYKITNYKLIPNETYGYVVNVNKTVNISNKNLKKIEVQFNQIVGDFYCCNNKLTSLEGCPHIVNGHFDCSNNQLSSLEYCPEIIEGTLWCNNNELNCLEGPKIIYEWLDCNNNKLTLNSLKRMNVDIKINYIEINNNKELGELENVTDFQELKEKVEDIFKIKKERSNLLN